MWNGCMMLQWVWCMYAYIYIFRIYTLGSRDFLSLLLPLLGKGKMCFHDRQAEEEDDDTEEEDDPLMGFNLSAPLSQTEFSAGKLFITLWQSVLQIERREGRGGLFMNANKKLLQNGHGLFASLDAMHFSGIRHLFSWGAALKAARVKPEMDWADWAASYVNFLWGPLHCQGLFNIEWVCMSSYLFEYIQTRWSKHIGTNDAASLVDNEHQHCKSLTASKAPQTDPTSAARESQWWRKVWCGGRVESSKLAPQKAQCGEIVCRKCNPEDGTAGTYSN